MWIKCYWAVRASVLDCVFLLTQHWTEEKVASGMKTNKNFRSSRMHDDDADSVTREGSRVNRLWQQWTHVVEDGWRRRAKTASKEVVGEGDRCSTL